MGIRFSLCILGPFNFMYKVVKKSYKLWLVGLPVSWVVKADRKTIPQMAIYCSVSWPVIYYQLWLLIYKTFMINSLMSFADWLISKRENLIELNCSVGGTVEIYQFIKNLYTLSKQSLGQHWYFWTLLENKSKQARPLAGISILDWYDFVTHIHWAIQNDLSGI